MRNDTANDTTKAANKAANILSRSGRMVKPRVFKDGTTAAESPRHSSAEDDLSPMAVDVKERLEKAEGSKSSNNSRSSNGDFSGMGKKRKCPSRATGGGIFKAAAVRVLQEEARLMTTGDITKLALQRGYISRSGKTPEATMASALYTDIKRRSSETAFIRPREGLFGLKQWHWHDADHGSGVEHAGVVENVRPAGSTEPKGPKMAPDPMGRALPASRLRTQAQADTTGSRCAAHPRDGLIELLSAAEKVNGVEGGPTRPLGKWTRQPAEPTQPAQPAQPAPVVRRRRKVFITSNQWDADTGWIRGAMANDANPTTDIGVARAGNDIINNNPEKPTASVGEKGSIADTMKHGDSTDLNNANGALDRDHCVQSPRTRVLSEIMPGFGGTLGTLCEAQAREVRGAQVDAMSSVSKQLSEILSCVNRCPDQNARSRALSAMIELEQVFAQHLAKTAGYGTMNGNLQYE